MKPPERILVIGAAGLIGRHVRAALTGRNVTATCHREKVADGIPVDVTDAVQVARVADRVRPQAIVLAAADPFVERCEADPDSTRRVNVEAARHVAAVAKRHDAVLVVFSSEYVFDGSAGTYGEDDERRPLNEYGRQKVVLEDIAAGVPRHIVCRTSGVFGSDAVRLNFVARLVDVLRSGRTFDVPSDQLITPTDAHSLADAVVELIDRGAQGIFHVAGPEIFERLVFASLVARTFDLPVDLLRFRPTSDLGLAAPRPLHAGLSTAKLRDTLGHGVEHPATALQRLREEGL